jgi:hypothetical protein
MFFAIRKYLIIFALVVAWMAGLHRSWWFSAIEGRQVWRQDRARPCSATRETHFRFFSPNGMIRP